MADVPGSAAKAWMDKAWRDLETAHRAAEGKRLIMTKVRKPW